MFYSQRNWPGQLGWLLRAPPHIGDQWAVKLKWGWSFQCSASGVSEVEVALSWPVRRGAGQGSTLIGLSRQFLATSDCHLYISRGRSLT
jgi:hypothetical protein